MKPMSGISIALLAGALVGCASTGGGTAAGTVQASADRSGRVALRESMRKL